MTLRPPAVVVPGACHCTGNQCICAPHDLGERMTLASIARLRAKEARDRNDAAEASRWTVEFRKLADEVNAALEWRTDRTDGETSMSSNTDRRTLIRHLESKRDMRFDGLEKADDRALALATVVSFGISPHQFRPGDFAPPLHHHSTDFIVGFAAELVRRGGFAVERADALDAEQQREAGAKAFRNSIAPTKENK